MSSSSLSWVEALLEPSVVPFMKPSSSRILNILLPVFLFSSLFNIGLAASPIAEGNEKFLGNLYWPGDATFLTYWNQVTPENNGKWQSVEPTRDVTDFSTLDSIYAFSRSNNLKFKEHTYIWGFNGGGGIPAWVNDIPQNEVLGEIDEWISAVAQHTLNAEFVDVFNEPTHEQVPAPVRNALGGDGSTGWDWTITLYQKARAAMPNAKLLINDYDIEKDNFALAKYKTVIGILAQRNLLDGIGCQGHFLEGTSGSTVKSALDQLSEFGLPIYISELDISIASDIGQLEKYKELFTVMWNHPAVKGITLWGYKQNQMWRADGYLLRTDGTERPALVWMRDFVSHSDGWAIPGKVEAEYCSGWSGCSAQVTSDAGGGIEMGSIDPGDAMDFQVKVAMPGTYDVAFRINSSSATQLQIKTGNTVLASKTVTGTGWQTVTAPGIYLPAGSQTLKIQLIAGNCSINYMNFTANSGTGTVATPIFSPAEGVYSTAQTVSISAATSGSTIRYTTDGSNPSSTNGIVYTSPISVTSSITVKALAYKSGMTDSAIVTSNYFISGATINISEEEALIDQPRYSALPKLSATDLTSLGGTDWAIFGWNGSSPSIVNSKNGATAIGTPTANLGSGSIDGGHGRMNWTYSDGTSPSSVTDQNLGGLGIQGNNSTDHSISFTATVPPQSNGSLYVWYSGFQGSHQLQARIGPIVRSASISAGSDNVTFKKIKIDYTTTTETSVVITLSATDRFSWNPISTIYGAALNATGVATPTFTPSAGDYGTAQSVAISTATSGATIRYTRDGSNPSSTSGSIYSSPINVSASSTIKAIAYTGQAESGVASADYTIGAINVQAPTFNPIGGTYSSAQSVAIATGTAGAVIRYSTDGNMPTSTNGTLYTGPINISSSTTLKAIAYKSGMGDSSVSTASYTIAQVSAVENPLFNPPAGTYSSAQSIGITSATSGATIRYTVDGSLPTSTNGIVYSGSFSVSSTRTVKAIAYKSGMSDSQLFSSLYTINTGGSSSTVSLAVQETLADQPRWKTTPAVANTNLSTLGNTDWAIFGWNSSNPSALNRKSGSSSISSPYANLGNGSVDVGHGRMNWTYSDGTTPASGAGQNLGGLGVQGNNSTNHSVGFTANVPAHSSGSLYVWYSGFQGNHQLTAQVGSSLATDNIFVGYENVTFKKVKIDYTTDTETSINVSVAAVDRYSWNPISTIYGAALSVAQVASPPPYTTWRNNAFGSDSSNPAIASAAADPNSNGIPNLLEYALGGNPLSVTTNNAIQPFLALSSDNKHLTLTYPRNPELNDISYVVEATSDLKGAWTPIASSTAGAAMVNLGGSLSITESGDPIKTVVVEDAVDVSAATKRFLRLRIQKSTP